MSTYHLRITGPSLTLDRDVPAAVVSDILGDVLAFEINTQNSTNDVVEYETALRRIKDALLAPHERANCIHNAIEIINSTLRPF